jgi:GNAT superfamily N-acetyltransferase
MHEDTSYRQFPLSEIKLLERVDLWLTNLWHRVTYVLEHEGAVVGVFSGYMGDLWFSETSCGFDEVIYIDPDHRGRHGFSQMLARFEDWCRERDCSAVLVGVSSGVMVERTGKLLGFLGYDKVGGLYRRTI